MEFEKYKVQIENGNFEDNWLILGIDISDSNTYLSYFNNRTKKVEPVDLSNGFGKPSISTAVQYRESTKEWIVGQEAYRTQDSFKENTVTSILENLQNEVKVKLGEEFYFPEVICSKLFNHVINNILERLPNSEIIGISVSVPNNFSRKDIEKVKEAFNIIGYKDKIISVINKQTANILNYNNQYKIENENLLILDFGAKNLDLSLISIKKNNATLIREEIINNHGGDTIDNILLNKFYSYITDNDISIDTLTDFNIAELKFKATETKEKFSGIDKARIPFTFCVPPFMKQMEIDEFLSLINKFIIKTKKSIENIYDNQKVSKIVVSGGLSNMKWVKDILIEIFKNEDLIILSEKPEVNTVNGACIYSCISLGLIKLEQLKLIKQHNFIESDLPYDIGILISDKFYPILNKGSSTYICKNEKIFDLDFEDNKNSLDLVFLKRYNKTDKIENLKIIDEFNFTDIIENTNNSKIKITLNLLGNRKKVYGEIILDNNIQKFEFSM